MNERIKKLADDCRTLYRDGSGEYVEQFDEEKFAELIVRECLDVVENTNDRYRKEYFADKIRQRFGVE